MRDVRPRPTSACCPTVRASTSRVRARTSNELVLSVQRLLLLLLPPPLPPLLLLPLPLLLLMMLLMLGSMVSARPCNMILARHKLT